LRIGLTVGDPAGIGPEVVARTLRAEPPVPDLCITVYGDLDAVGRAGGLAPGVATRGFCSAKVEPGRPDPAAAAGMVEAIRAAALDCLSGALDAMVTGPISKEITARAGFTFPGHTELLQEIAGAERAVMLLAGGRLRVALATIHCPLREVPGRISPKGLLEILRVIDAGLRRRFAIASPRVAVCGLNPHAGEGGRFGEEERLQIAPAVERARAEGIQAVGPLSADSLFHRAALGEFDCVLAMYHDQGLAPLKLHAFGRAANVTLGLPFVRTSVDHGTAFDIAGRGIADPGSMIEALRVAAQLALRERHAAHADAADRGCA
jgi:4-hydroxythreonine-4-phosphate dehydrogenase